MDCGRSAKHRGQQTQQSEAGETGKTLSVGAHSNLAEGGSSIAGRVEKTRSLRIVIEKPGRVGFPKQKLVGKGMEERERVQRRSDTGRVKEK